MTGIVFLPPLLLVAAFLVGGWRYATGLEVAGLLFLGMGVVASLWLMASGRWAERERTVSLVIWELDIVKHRRPFALLLLVFGGYALWSAARDIGDWMVPPDTRSVVIDRSYVTFRSGVTYLYTDDGTYQGPWFVSFDVEPGPAQLTLGHFSEHVLAIDPPR